MQFDDLRLSKPLLRAVHASGYETPTPIQAQAIPPVLEGHDVLGIAQTGTGKTAAFALPMLERMQPRQNDEQTDVAAAMTGNRRRRRRTPAGERRIRGLVLAPTRELAQQIYDSFRTYGEHTDLRAVVLFGGVNQNRQVRDLEHGADIVVACPGRLLDLLNQNLLTLGSVEVLVLDEADRMLDMGFMPDIRRIVAQVPARRQSLLFSATMPGPIRELADDMLSDPVTVRVTPTSSAAETVEQWVYHVEKDDKTALLTHILREDLEARTLVFSRTKHGADRLVRMLGKAKIPAAALHGNKSQGARTRALAGFRSGETPVLIATDIAARGLDVDDVSLVINYDMTPDPETYVHRIGRTGRAGAEGEAITLCMPDQVADLRAIEKLLRMKIEVADLPPLPKKAPPKGGKPDPKAAKPKPARKATPPPARKKTQRPSHPLNTTSQRRRRGGKKNAGKS